MTLAGRLTQGLRFPHSSWDAFHLINLRCSADIPSHNPLRMAQKTIQSPEACGEIQFIEIKNPVDVSWRSAVRSHTARGHYRKARQRELLQHWQLTKRRQQSAQAGLIPPETLLLIRSADPFNTLILTATQRLLEESCFGFISQWLPDLVRDHNWESAAAVEINRWLESSLIPGGKHLLTQISPDLWGRES